MKLFTMGQGDPIVSFVDYKCGSCSEWNAYTGQYHGIITARKHTAHTVELMYHWVLTFCLLSASYRTSFALSRLFNQSEGCRSRLKCGNVFQIDGVSRVNRRLANDAFGRFLGTIETDIKGATDFNVQL